MPCVLSRPWVLASDLSLTGCTVGSQETRQGLLEKVHCKGGSIVGMGKMKVRRWNPGCGRHKRGWVWECGVGAIKDRKCAQKPRGSPLTTVQLGS